METRPTVNFERLRAHLTELSRIGKGADGGLYRTAFSEGDMEGRAWLKEKIRIAGLELRQDGAGNISALLPGRQPELPVVATGSHLDTVPGGGHLDGALGVLAGLEALQSVQEHGTTTARTLELINFSDEEGRFGGLLGSQAITGQLRPERLKEARDLEGVLLSQALAERGLELSRVSEAARPPGAVDAFVELHIEQGPVLEEKGVPLGVVDRVAGLFKWKVSLFGSPAHSGTTPMNRRRDALQGAAEFMCGTDSLLARHGSSVGVCNVGRIEAFPGVANVVPGQVDFTLEVRDVQEDQLHQLGRAFETELNDLCRRRRLNLTLEKVSLVAPKACHPAIVEAIESAAKEFDYPFLRMASGAIHDCQIMGEVTRASMIFVPSRGGRSHCPEEWTDWDQIHAGAEVLTHTLYRLAL